MIFILNRKEEIVGVLNNEGDASMITPYFDDNFTEDLSTGASTFEFSTVGNSQYSEHIAIGNFVAFQDDIEGFQMFQITDIEETHSETMIKTAYCEGVCLELLNEVVRPLEIASANPKQLLASLLNSTAWEVGEVSEDLVTIDTYTIEDYPNVYKAIQDLVINQLGAEIKFRVTLNDNHVTGRYIDLFKARGSVTNFRFEYGVNMSSVVKTVDSSELCTGLIGIGKDGLTFKNVAYYDKPLNQDFITDSDAFARWNNKGSHIMGTFSYDTDSQHELYIKTKEELKKRSVPKISYETNVELFGASVKLGDEVQVIDHEFNPPLYLTARVSNLSKSRANNSVTCTLANYKEYAEVSNKVPNIDNFDEVMGAIKEYLDSINGRLTEQDILQLKQFLTQLNVDKAEIDNLLNRFEPVPDGEGEDNSGDTDEGDEWIEDDNNAGSGGTGSGGSSGGSGGTGGSGSNGSTGGGSTGGTGSGSGSSGGSGSGSTTKPPSGGSSGGTTTKPPSGGSTGGTTTKPPSNNTVAKPDKDYTNTVQGSTFNQTLKDGLNYNCGTLKSVTFTLPSSPKKSFKTTFTFTTPYNCKPIYFNQTNTVWLKGTDCISGALIPKAHTKYKMVITYDGNTTTARKYKGTVTVVSRGKGKYTKAPKQAYASKIVEFAKTYKDNKSKFKYDHTTPVGLQEEGKNPASHVSKWKTGGKGHIDCSSYTNQLYRGRPYKESIYYNTKNKATANPKYSWAFHLGRTASAQAQKCVQNGWVLDIDPKNPKDWWNLQPGDLVFWSSRYETNAKKIANRFMQVGHVAIIRTPKTPSGKTTTYEVTKIKGNPDCLINRALQNNFPKKILFFARPRR